MNGLTNWARDQSYVRIGGQKADGIYGRNQEERTDGRTDGRIEAAAAVAWSLVRN